MCRLEIANFPCKDCAERQVGCHGKCERYIESKKRLEEYDVMVRAAKTNQDYSRPLIPQTYSKTKREKLERKRSQR